MANNNWDDVINGSDFNRWKETASAICSNVDDRAQRDELLKKLAKRLFAQKNKTAAISLSLLSNDAEGVVLLLLNEIEEVFGSLSNGPDSNNMYADYFNQLEEYNLNDNQKNIVLIENLQKVYAIIQTQNIKTNSPLLQRYLVRFAYLALDHNEPKLA